MGAHSTIFSSNFCSLLFPTSRCPKLISLNWVLNPGSRKINLATKNSLTTTKTPITLPRFENPQHPPPRSTQIQINPAKLQLLDAPNKGFEHKTTPIASLFRPHFTSAHSITILFVAVCTHNFSLIPDPRYLRVLNTHGTLDSENKRQK